MTARPKSPKASRFRAAFRLTLDHWLVIGPIVLAVMVAGWLLLIS